MRISVENNRALTLLFAILILSLSLNVFLGWRVRTLAGLSHQIWRQSGMPVGPVLSVRAWNLDGRPVVLEFNRKIPTVLYILSPTCGWCRKNEENIRILAARADSHFQFIGLSSTTDKLQEYVASRHLPFAVYAVDLSGAPQNLDFGTTPQTVVISSSGVVQKVWIGVFDGYVKRDIEEFFKVDLPGISLQQR